MVGGVVVAEVAGEDASDVGAAVEVVLEVVTAWLSLEAVEVVDAVDGTELAAAELEGAGD